MRHVGLGKVDARGAAGLWNESARVVRDNPYRVADEIDGIDFVTANSWRVMQPLG